MNKPTRARERIFSHLPRHSVSSQLTPRPTPGLLYCPTGKERLLSELYFSGHLMLVFPFDFLVRKELGRVERDGEKTGSLRPLCLFLSIKAGDGQLMAVFPWGNFPLCLQTWVPWLHREMIRWGFSFPLFFLLVSPSLSVQVSVQVSTVCWPYPTPISIFPPFLIPRLPGSHFCSLLLPYVSI